MPLVGQPRLLVVDDDERSRRLLRALLEPMGCAVTEAAGGQEGLDRLEDGGWDVVLLDLNMPGIDGFEVLERLRAKWPMEHLPVILVTGMDDAEARQRGLELRANEFLSKPVDRSELLVRIGGLLAFRRAQAILEDEIAELKPATAFRTWLAGSLEADLGAPLTEARRVLRGALEGPGVEDAAKHRIQEGLEALEDAGVILARAAAFARTEERHEPLRVAAVDLQELCLARVEAAQRRALRREVAVGLVLGSHVGAVAADVSRLTRVMDHLLAAAVAQSAVRGRVDVGLTQDDAAGEVRVEVRLAEGWQGSLQPVDGTGLGFCRRAVESMGGRLRAEGTPGKTSALCFSLRLHKGIESYARTGGVAQFAPGANPV
ncbi:MAG: response regulator [Candidatus Coatesbacteria bacterium]